MNLLVSYSLLEGNNHSIALQMSFSSQASIDSGTRAIAKSFSVSTLAMMTASLLVFGSVHPLSLELKGLSKEHLLVLSLHTM